MPNIKLVFDYNNRCYVIRKKLFAKKSELLRYIQLVGGTK